MKFAAIAMTFLLGFASEAEARSISVRSTSGKEISDVVHRTCTPAQWKKISAWFEQVDFASRQFPAVDFEIERGKMNGQIRSETENLNVTNIEGSLPRFEIGGQVFEGSLCEIIVKITEVKTIEKVSWMDLFVPRANAREVIQTEISNWRKAGWVGVGVVAAGAAVLTWPVTVLGAGGFAAVGAGVIAGDSLGQSMKVEDGRRRLEAEAANLAKSKILDPIICTPTSVDMQSGRDYIVLTRGNDPYIDITTSRYKGRLRASYSPATRAIVKRFKNCNNDGDVARINPPTPRAQPQRYQPISPGSTVDALPPESLVRAPPPTKSADREMGELDGLLEVPEDVTKDMTTFTKD
ncbi:MAG: hypothetical protein AAB250_15050, partial [Bdellovibrionota bacterium]